MTLRIVSTRNWIAEQFKGLDTHVVLDFGLDFDPANLGDYWWAPGAWAARVKKSGFHLPLMSCGVDWLPNLPKEYRGRKVQNKRLIEVFPGVTGPTFAKLPEVKHDGVPAKVYGECYLRDTLAQYNLPAETIWQLQAPVEFVGEMRFWIAHGEVVADSPYRWQNLIWGDPDFAPTVEMMAVFHHLRDMSEFAAEVARTVPGPPGYVLDVGIDEYGWPMVVEANAAWSSGPYDGDPAGIFEAIKASHDFAGKYPEWAWRHSPVFDRVAPLKVVHRM